MKAQLLFILLIPSFSWAETCYTLQSGDLTRVTLQVPREICFQKFSVSLGEKLILASSRKTPALMTDFDLVALTAKPGSGYRFQASNELLVATLPTCGKTESVQLEVSGETNGKGDTHPSQFEVSIKHSLKDTHCDIQDVKNVYQYTVKP